MSNDILEKPRIQDIIDNARMPLKCRIPRSVRSDRRGVTVRNKINNTDLTQRSTSRGKVDKLQVTDTTRSARQERDRVSSALKRQPMISRRMPNDNPKGKAGSPVIMVPVQQPKPVRMLYSNKNTGRLPDQETINQYEELEMQQSASSEGLGYGDLSGCDNRKMDKDLKQDIISEWRKRNDEFQKMKSDLNQKQRSILDLYASLNIIHKKMVEAGHSADVPLAEDLHIMNVAKMTPEQLLKLCAESSKIKNNLKVLDELPLDNRMVLDKLYNIPGKLFATCEQVLANKKIIIDWLDSLKSQISVQHLKQKIQEFNTENEMLAGALKNIKTECMTQVQEVEYYIRERVNDTMALHLQTENLTYKLSELNSHNADLQKQLNNVESLKSYSNKSKVLELEKDLKEKQKSMKERLSRAEGQVKIGAEHASQLEAALDKVNAELDSKVALINQLQEQNEKLQRSYDEELKKLNEAVGENTINLEQIAQDREKIQFEKNDLESKLAQLTMYYNESLNNTKLELKANIIKLNEAETKYSIEIEEQKKIASDHRTQVMETELQNKLLLQKIEEMEYSLANAKELEEDYNNLKQELEKERLETKNYKNIMLQQTETIREMEINLKVSQEESEIINQNILVQEEYITEFKNRENILKSQLQDSEAKMEYYEKELIKLKDHIVQLQEQFSGLKDINELQETMKKQKEELDIITNQNNELSETIQKNLVELNDALETNKIQKQRLQEKEDLIKTLIKSEEEQCNIIKQLRNNLDVRSNEDSEILKELEVKKLEINNLVDNLDTRKQQILQLEKIVLTLEDKVRKSNSIRRKCEEKINLLEMKIGIYESNQYKEGVEANSKNLNKFLKLLEEEMETPVEAQDKINDRCSEITKNSNNSDKDREKNYSVHHEKRNHNELDQRTMLKKHAMSENLVKKVLTPKGDLFNGDYLDRKDNIYQKTKTFALDVDASDEPKRKVTNHHLHDKMLSRNLQALLYGKHLSDKKEKMFVLAGHRL